MIVTFLHLVIRVRIGNFTSILQVILSPVDSVGDTYRALLPEGTPSEFQRILELKVLFLPLMFSAFVAFGVVKKVGSSSGTILINQ